MTPKPKRPAHAGLDKHNQRIAEAAAALREAEHAERQAVTAVEQARDQVREAADLGLDATEALASLDQAKQDHERATLGREGVEQRAKRAAAERDGYLAEYGEALLSELQPDCEAVVRELRAHAEALLKADKRWRELSAKVAGHLRSLNLTPHSNAPGSHGLESVCTDLRRALQSDITSPGPHWTERHAAEQEQENRAIVRRERDRERQAA